MKTIILALCIALTAVGCASSGRKIDQAKVSQIHNGSTGPEVRKLIGAPETVMKDATGGETWSYSYVYASAKGENFIPVVNLFASGANVQSSSLTVYLNPQGVVTNFVSSNSASDINTGISSSAGRPAADVKDGKRPK